MKLNILELAESRSTGLAIHYPLIWSVVKGLEVKAAFEFGTGWSTKVITNALDDDALLISISTQTKEELESKYNITHKRWWHRTDNSNNLIESDFKRFMADIKLDFVLHDGAHDYETVKRDLNLIVPYMKYNSILLVHDVLHEKCGKDVLRALDSECAYETESAILSYGYGLAIIRIKSLTLKEKNGSVLITKEKVGSKYKTIT